MKFSFSYILACTLCFCFVSDANAYSISGTVTSEAGQPLTNIKILACPTTSGSCPSRYTNDEGTYTLYLADGLSYRIEAIPPPESLYVNEYYKDTLTWSDITPVDATFTESPVDFQLRYLGFA